VTCLLNLLLNKWTQNFSSENEKNNEGTCKYSWPFGRDSNLELFKHETEVLTSTPIYSVDSTYTGWWKCHANHSLHNMYLSTNKIHWNRKTKTSVIFSVGNEHRVKDVCIQSFPYVRCKRIKIFFDDVLNTEHTIFCCWAINLYT
jgi:hypothetical protein